VGIIYFHTKSFHHYFPLILPFHNGRCDAQITTLTTLNKGQGSPIEVGVTVAKQVYTGFTLFCGSNRDKKGIDLNLSTNQITFIYP